MTKLEYKICTKTIMDTSDPGIKFNEKGESDYYLNFINNIIPNWDTNEAGYSKLMQTAEKIKKEGKGKEEVWLSQGQVQV